MSYIAHLHADIVNARATRRGMGDEIDRARKSYPRLPQIPLPKPSDIQVTLSKMDEQRPSSATARTGDSLSLPEYGTLLGNAYDEELLKSPIELYVITETMEGYAPAAFHYDPSTHALENLSLLSPDTLVKELGRDSVPIDASTMIILTGVWPRASAAHGDYGYLLAILAAGTISRNITLAAAAVGRRARLLEGFDAHAIRTLLDLDPEAEQAITAIAIY